MPDAVTALPPAPPLPPKRGVAWLAWVVILLIVGTEVLLPGFLRRFHPTAERIAAEDRSAGVVADMQVRSLVGVAQLTGGDKALFAQAATLNTGPLTHAALHRPGRRVGRSRGGPQADRSAESAARRTARRVSGRTGSGPGRRSTRLYRDRRDHTESLTEADREIIHRQLGWSGELALTPADSPDQAARAQIMRPARRFAVTYLIVLGVAVPLVLAGLLWFVTWAVFFLMGETPRSLPPATRHGGIYAEAFAAYMVAFLGLSVAYRLLKVPGPELLVEAALMLLSLAAGITWPVIRGVPSRQVRQEVGLTLGRRPWLEPAIGLAGYAFVLPVFAIGLIVTLVLTQIDRQWQLGDRPEEHFAPISQPTHPILEWLQHPDWKLVAQVVLIASILAPLVEETMFRGVLYRHLRNATARLGRTSSFLISTLVVSFIFAVIHPQGILGVPVLMALAFGLTCLREWRGSLLPSMMVHGLHNGLATFVLVQALRS